MDSYIKAVDHIASIKLDSEFDNKGADHAAVVLASMLKHAKKDFKIFSSTFSSDVADKELFLETLNDFITSGKSFKLMLEKLPDEGSMSVVLKKVIEQSLLSPDTVKYKVANDDFKKELARRFKNGNTYHFAVSDSTAFRLEVDATEHKAICNFNDAKIAKKLSSVFDRFF